MNTDLQFRKPRQTGSALVLTLVMSGIALAILAGAMTWSANSTKLTQRSVEYNRTVAAAEGSTEKVVSQITQDYLSGGEKLVLDNVPTYRTTVPTSSDSPFWSTWEFSDALGHTGQTFVQGGPTNYVLLDSAYAGLHGFASTFTVVSHAREIGGAQSVVAGVLQQMQLARIPVFQFAMYSSGDMEISCGSPFYISGRVHSNKTLYVEPDSVLTFGSAVTAVMDILSQRHPDDSRGAPSGSEVDVHPEQRRAPVPALTLPIGLTNTPEAIREIIQPPPDGEDANSPLGRLRYYNQAEMIIVVSNSDISATSGKFNDFATVITNSEIKTFVGTNNTFWDAREGKTIRPIDINIGALKTWSETNNSLRFALGTNAVSSVYVWDRRTLPGTDLEAVRVLNGVQLPSRGLTIATAYPLYVWGNYNQTNAANLGTTNTITTKPASLVGDAITVLSTNWSDTTSSAHSLDSRPLPGATTVNAAFLTGVVETAGGNYSGGMENFPRFLEKWTGIVFTYNGSMVKMFNSRYATNIWGKTDVYKPPPRNWAYDLNFDDANKIPPLTPSLVKVLRGKWATVAPDKNIVTAGP